MNDDEHHVPALLNIEELAELLGVPVATIRKWRTLRPRYGPPATNVGRHLRWNPATVAKWIAEQTEGDGNVGFRRI